MNALFVIKRVVWGLASLLVSLQAQALSMVVTPGTSASYLYFPPASVSGTGSGNTTNASTSTVLVASAGVGRALLVVTWLMKTRTCALPGCRLLLYRGRAGARCRRHRVGSSQRPPAVCVLRDVGDLLQRHRPLPWAGAAG